MFYTYRAQHPQLRNGETRAGESGNERDQTQSPDPTRTQA